MDSLREALAALTLNTRGNKPTLKKRLRTASKRSKAERAGSRAEGRPISSNKVKGRPPGQDFDSYLVLDFEATCQKYELRHGDPFSFPNEVRELGLPSFKKLIMILILPDNRISSPAFAMVSKRKL